MLKRIQFSEGTARKYMAIAAHPVISNRSGWNALPPSWTTLYELTKLPHGIFQARIDDDTITPEFEGTAVASLKAELAGSRSSRRHDSQERIAELQRENDLLRSEVEALRAELEDREASQSNARQRWRPASLN
jgi:hypothetical protein